MTVLLPEKFRQFGHLPLITVLNLFARLHTSTDEKPQSYGRRETRTHEKIRRRIRKASQQRNR